eukprot:TRINITY_DN1598_c0_g1_i2.p1 TRINITY_DN1598_c0_g1~~TRINITY_DN1598_c0_g1_i2.p1  ORF type:complete len:321 (-),score=76.27 TRINITY_DN1598_c0_g1_i2:253-1185(-)
MSSGNIDFSENIVSIKNLNPFQPWTIRARCTNKAPIKTFTSKKGEKGKLCSVDLVDSTGELRATMFNECVDLFEPIFQVNNVYIVSKGTLKAGDPKWTKSELELTLKATSVVQQVEVGGNDKKVPKTWYNFVPIDKITELDNNSLIDTMGIISVVNKPTSINTKDNRSLNKRTISIVDSTKRSVDVTLWGDRATNFDGEVGVALALKNVKVNEYQGNKTLSATSNTLIELNPDSEPAKKLGAWWELNGSKEAHSISGQKSQKGGGGGGGSAVQCSILQLNEEAARIEDDKALFRKVMFEHTIIVNIHMND